MTVFGFGDEESIKRVIRSTRQLEGTPNKLANPGQNISRPVDLRIAVSTGGLSSDSSDAGLFAVYRSTSTGTSETTAPPGNVNAYNWLRQGFSDGDKAILIRPIPSPRWYALKPEAGGAGGTTLTVMGFGSMTSSGLLNASVLGTTPWTGWSTDNRNSGAEIKSDGTIIPLSTGWWVFGVDIAVAINDPTTLTDGTTPHSAGTRFLVELTGSIPAGGNRWDHQLPIINEGSIEQHVSGSGINQVTANSTQNTILIDYQCSHDVSVKRAHYYAFQISE